MIISFQSGVEIDGLFDLILAFSFCIIKLGTAKRRTEKLLGSFFYSFTPKGNDLSPQPLTFPLTEKSLGSRT